MLFRSLTRREGFTVANLDVLDGRTLTANFKACSMRETLERLAASLDLSLATSGRELRFVAGTPDHG